jgi:para-nitrobenzyl esterase
MAAIATTKRGRVEGREKEGVLLFAGIPYAAPPLGPLRFRPPQSHAGWSGVLDARRFGPAAPQLPRGGLTDAAPVRWDEDCLTLNVATPGLDDRGRPVLVWIHGGAFRTGQGGIPWYNGASFARRGDVVTVSINYRLGALGFAHLAELGGAGYASSGLNGLLDQIAALEWVQENIAAFGGDPARVTVAGESAGAMSVGTLLGCPSAAGLFEKAIAQSGAAHHTLSADVAAEIARLLARRLDAATLDDLQRVPVERILEAQREVEDEVAAASTLGGVDVSALGDMAFQPVVDGAVLPEAPLEAIRRGASAPVQVLTGTNRNETTLWGYGEVDRAGLRRIAARHFENPDAALAVYESARPGASAHDLVIALTTDHMFRIPAIRLAEGHADGGGTAYMYEFSWESRAFDGRLKATHALEIPFVFNNLERAGVDVFLGPGPLPQELAEVMHDAWISFIRTGEPCHPGLPSWPAYTASRRAVMELGDRLRVRHDPDGAERALWEGLR